MTAKELPDRITPDNAEEVFNPSTEWLNFGDANPDRHGGMWIRYDAERERFDVVHTVPMIDVWPDEDRYHEGRQYVTQTVLYWDDDILTDDGEWADAMTRVLDQFSGPNPTPETVAVDDRLEYYAVDIPNVVAINARHDKTDEETYADVLEAYGVDPTDE